MTASVAGTAVFKFFDAILSHIQASHKPTFTFHRYRRLLGRQSVPSSDEMFALHGEARVQNILIDLLYHNCNLLLSRDHDRLYAIMHLAQNYQDGDIAVDYTNSLKQVMLDVATHHISRHENLAFLLYKYQSSEDDLGYTKGLAWPSWISGFWFNGGRHSASSDFRNKDRIYSKCGLSPLDGRTMRLRVRGARIDLLRQVFDLERGFDKITVMQFWTSTLGRHLQPYMPENAASLPSELYQTMGSHFWAKSASHECLKGALAYLHKLSQVAEFANLIILADDTALLPGWGQTMYAMMEEFLMHALSYGFALTERKFLALLPKCNAKEIDESWMVLGCSRPIVLRRQGDEAYSHLCAASIPGLTDLLKEHEDFAKFTMETQPGEKIGE